MSSQKKMKKFRMATRGSRAYSQSPISRLLSTCQAKKAASIQASHFTFTGRMNINSTCILGKRTAKAKTMDILT